MITKRDLKRQSLRGPKNADEHNASTASWLLNISFLLGIGQKFLDSGRRGVCISHIEMVWFCWHFEFVVDDIVVSLFINSIRRQGSNNCADSVRREALSSLMANILHDSIVQIPWMCDRLCTWESKRSHMVRAMAITIARTRGRQKIKKSRRRILKTWSRWSTLD